MKHRRRWLISGLVLIGLVALAVLIVRQLGRPATGVIKNSPASATGPKSYGTKLYTGQQISFRADERYSLKASAQGARGLDSYVFIFSGPYRRLAVAVDNLPLGGLSEYPAIQTRTLHPDNYTRTSQNYGGETYTIFTARDGTEVGAFAAHGSRVVSVDITMPESQPAAASDLSNFLTSLRWR